MADVTLEMTQYVVGTIIPKDQQGNPINADYKPGSLVLTVSDPTVLSVENFGPTELQKKFIPLKGGTVTVNYSVRSLATNQLINGQPKTVQVNGFVTTTVDLAFGPVQTQ